LHKKTKEAALMNEGKVEGNKAFYSRVGVVTPGCSGGGNPTKLVSICPAISGGFIQNKVIKAFKSLAMSTFSYIISLTEMTQLPDPAQALTGSCGYQVGSGRKNCGSILIVQ
jgi:hypothetical protein